MEKSLDRKLAALHADPSGCKEFILCDAKDLYTTDFETMTPRAKLEYNQRRRDRIFG